MSGDDDGFTCFRDQERDRLHPLPCRIGAECLDEVQDLLDHGDRALHRLVDRLGPDATEVPLAAREIDLLFNVNAPEDVARLFKMLRREAEGPEIDTT